MMSLYYLGVSMERYLGTTTFALATLAIAVLSNVLYVAVCWGIAYASSLGPAATAARGAGWLHYHSVGYSGVLFALCAMEAFLSPAQSRSVFGLFSVPTKVYPVVLMVLLSLFMPQISFLGHASGLALGVLYVHGLLGRCLPGRARVERLEARRCCSAGCGRARFPRRFVPVHDDRPLPGEPGGGVAGGAGALRAHVRQLACCAWRGVARPLLQCARGLAVDVWRGTRGAMAGASGAVARRRRGRQGWAPVSTTEEDTTDGEAGGGGGGGDVEMGAGAVGDRGVAADVVAATPGGAPGGAPPSARDAAARAAAARAAVARQHSAAVTK